MNKHYENLSTPPADALKKIEGGSLKGRSDINPQWRYEALTKEFGLCGFGWKYEIVNMFAEPVPVTQEVLIFVKVNLYVKDGDEWSAPIPAFGGDMLVIKDKNGIHGNDEGIKMAITDALGTAAKMVGVAATVYRGQMDSKYARNTESAPAKPKAKSKEDKTMDTLRAIAETAKKQGISSDDMKEILKRKYSKASSKELTETEVADLAKNIVEYAKEIVEEEAAMMGGIE